MNQSGDTHPTNMIDTPQGPIHLHINNINTNTNVNAMGSAYSSKSRMVALILCIFFGFFGVHCFYLGKVPTGILYFLTFGLFCVGWLWDTVMSIMNNAKDGNGLPLR